MGWSWRRSISLGPLRLNFSKCGVGMSFGGHGVRVSTGPRGSFMSLGAAGFRYAIRIGRPISAPATPGSHAAVPLQFGARGSSIQPSSPASAGIQASANKGDILEWH